MTTSDELDREHIATYTLTIEARDNNLDDVDQRQKTPEYMTIELRDVNDNAPIFQQSSYHRNTRENIGVNADILIGRAMCFRDNVPLLCVLHVHVVHAACILLCTSKWLKQE